MRLCFDHIEGSGDLYLDVLKEICGETSQKSMLDLGCHKAPYTPLLGFQTRMYVDVQNRSLDHKKEQPFFIQDTWVDFFVKNHGHKWDVIIASDFIEHLPKAEGRDLIWAMRVASETPIIFTPLGSYLVDEENPHPDNHRSGWMPEEFEVLGWTTVVFPNFHPSINMGAFFAFYADNATEISLNLRDKISTTWTPTCS